MTNEEAIEILQTADFPEDYTVTEIQQALDMAIQALEFKTNYDKFWEEVKIAGYKGREVEIHSGERVFMIREVAQ